jgi:hypothetical protein
VPPRRVIIIGHPLLGVTADWQVFARGPDDLLRIELARGRIVQTYVPTLETASPAVAFLVGQQEAVIRPADLVPGYVVPDNGQARQLTGVLAGGGPMVAGPAGSQSAWMTSGPPILPELSLATLTGHRSGPSIHFQPGGPQLPDTAVSDGRGDVLVTDGHFDDYDAGPGWDRLVPGTIVAVGPAAWLVNVCSARYVHCRDEVVDPATGTRRILPGPAFAAAPYYLSWPPTGVTAPDGSTAAVAETGRRGWLTLHLIDLRTGVTRELDVPFGPPGSDLPLGSESNEQSMAWSPDGRWLFVAAYGGKLVAVNPRTGRAETLGVSLPAVDQVAVRP